MRSLVLVILILGLAVGAWVMRNPLDSADLFWRLQIRFHGVQERQIDGLHAFVADDCDGKSECGCVALIHGLGDQAITWKSFLVAPHSAWKKKLRFYAVDLPGTAGSEPPTQNSGYRVREQAAKLRHALAPICPSWTIVGNSLGGWIAAWLALDWKEGVQKLLLVDAAGLEKEVDRAKVNDYFVDPTAESSRRFLHDLYAHPPPDSDYLYEKFAQRLRKSTAKDIVMAQIPADWLDGRLSGIQVPTLFFWGTSDGITPLSWGKKMSTMIPGSLWREISDCGHLPQRECPEPLISAVNELLTLSSSAAPGK